MGLYRKVRDAEGLTEREQEIRKFVLSYPEKLYEMSAKELGEATYSSAAAITRFCNKMDCKGYPDFKIRFLQDVQNENSDTETHLDMNNRESTASIMKKVAQSKIDIIQRTRTENSIDRISKASKMIHDADMLDFYTYNLNNHLAEYARHKFSIAGKFCNVYSEDSLQLRSTLFQQKNHLSILISQTGENKRIIELAKIKKKKGEKFLAITKPDSTIAKLADHTIYICGSDMQWMYIEEMWISRYSDSVKYLLDVLSNMEYMKNQEYCREMDCEYNRIGSEKFWTLTYDWKEQNDRDDTPEKEGN